MPYVYEKGDLDTQIELAQDDVRYQSNPSVVLISEIDKLVQACRRERATQETTIHALLLLAYAIFKAGRIREKRYLPPVQALASVAYSTESHLALKMAARWLYGRIMLAMAASSTEELGRRRAWSREAYINFAGIEEVDLRRPVLLPSTDMEYPEHLYQAAGFGGDPLVVKILPPYRYLAVTAGNIAGFWQADSADFAQRATHHSLTLNDVHQDALVTKLNGDLAGLMTSSLSPRITVKESSALRHRIDELHIRITDLTPISRLMTKRADEFRAACFAMSVIQLDRGGSSKSAFEQMTRSLTSLVTKHYGGRIPDFPTVDRVYFEAFLRSCGGSESSYFAYLREMARKID